MGKFWDTVMGRDCDPHVEFDVDPEAEETPAEDWQEESVALTELRGYDAGVVADHLLKYINNHADEIGPDGLVRLTDAYGVVVAERQRANKLAKSMRRAWKL